MKVSRETMAEHREAILVSAAKKFRECGFDGIGVSDLMKEVGLTHGGFYGHFANKEELIALASERAMNDSVERWEEVMKRAKGDPLVAFAHYYVSKGYTGGGCLYGTVGSEIARQPSSVKAAVTGTLEKFFGLLGRYINGRNAEDRRRKAIAAYASLVGGMVLARSVEDQTLAKEILDAVATTLPHGSTPKVIEHA